MSDRYRHSFFSPGKKTNFEIFTEERIFRVWRRTDTFLIPTHRERSIYHSLSMSTCTLGLSKPPSMKRLTFFPSQKSSFLMIFWWFLMIFDVFGVFNDILINFADFCRTLWTLSTMLDVVSILIFVYATLWVRFPNPRLAKYCLSHS